MGSSLVWTCVTLWQFHIQSEFFRDIGLCDGSWADVSQHCCTNGLTLSLKKRFGERKSDVCDSRGAGGGILRLISGAEKSCSSEISHTNRLLYCWEGTQQHWLQCKARLRSFYHRRLHSPRAFTHLFGCMIPPVCMHVWCLTCGVGPLSGNSPAVLGTNPPSLQESLQGALLPGWGNAAEPFGTTQGVHATRLTLGQNCGAAGSVMVPRGPTRSQWIPAGGTDLEGAQVDRSGPWSAVSYQQQDNGSWVGEDRHFLFRSQASHCHSLSVKCGWCYFWLYFSLCLLFSPLSSVLCLLPHSGFSFCFAGWVPCSARGHKWRLRETPRSTGF